MKEFQLTDSGVRLRFHDFAGDKPAIVFIHGLGCAGSLVYPAVAMQPVLQGYRRIVIDLPGFGYSDHADIASYTLANQVDALCRLLTALDIQKLHLFGHSMGGAIAVMLAARLQDKILSLTLAEANLDVGGGFFSKRIAAQTVDDYVSTGHAEMIRAATDAGAPSWAASMRVADPLAVYAGACDLVAGSTPSWREQLYGFGFPRSFLFGEYSLPDEDVRILPQHGIRIGVVKAAGHNMAINNPIGLADEIAAAVAVVSG